MANAERKKRLISCTSKLMVCGLRLNLRPKRYDSRSRASNWHAIFLRLFCRFDVSYVKNVPSSFSETISCMYAYENCFGELLTQLLCVWVANFVHCKRLTIVPYKTALTVQVSSSVKDKLSAATEEVKESFKFGKEESAESASSSGTRTSQGEKQQHQQSGSTEELHTFFAKFKSSLSSPKVSEAFYKLKEAKPFDIVKKALDIVKDELRGNPSRKKFLEYTPPPPFTGERSMRTEMVVTPTKQSKGQQKWESFKEKVSSHLCLFHLCHVLKALVECFP